MSLCLVESQRRVRTGPCCLRTFRRSSPAGSKRLGDKAQAFLPPVSCRVPHTGAYTQGAGWATQPPRDRSTEGSWPARELPRALRRVMRQCGAGNVAGKPKSPDSSLDLGCPPTGDGSVTLNSGGLGWVRAARVLLQRSPRRSLQKKRLDTKHHQRRDHVVWHLEHSQRRLEEHSKPQVPSPKPPRALTSALLCVSPPVSLRPSSFTSVYP